MADVFLQETLISVLFHGTENHLFLVDVTKVVENGKVAQKTYYEVNIIPNKKIQSHAKPCRHSRQVGFVSEQQQLLHVDLVKKKVAKCQNSLLKPKNSENEGVK